MTALIESLELGWDKNQTTWLDDLCPEVVAHFQHFPSFLSNPYPDAPLLTTQYGAHVVCLLHVTQVAAASVNTQVILHAGSQLAAQIHGQPIPWDDDVDVLLPKGKEDASMAVCEDGFQVHANVKLYCIRDFNALKLWLQPKGFKKMTHHKRKHYSPYGDMFLYDIRTRARRGHNITVLQEVAPSSGKAKKMSFPIEDVFPVQPFYFGGSTSWEPMKTTWRKDATILMHASLAPGSIGWNVVVPNNSETSISTATK